MSTVNKQKKLNGPRSILFDFRPIHTQRIPANVKDVIIGDINGDGSTELVISLTDRVVSTDQSEASQSEAVYVGEDLQVAGCVPLHP